MKSVQSILIPSAEQETIGELLHSYRLRFPNCGALVFTAERDRENIPSIQKIFLREDVPMGGAVFPALVYDEDFIDNGFLIYLFPESPIFIFQRDFERLGLVSSTLQFVEAVKSAIADVEVASLMLLFDGMIPRIASILETIYLNIEDRVKYFGANAGSETFESIPCIYDRHEIVSNAYMGVIFRPHIETILEHGYRIPESMIAATSTVGNRIISIDWKPAFTVYSSLIERDYHIKITPENFYSYAVHFPFGIIRADGEVLVRIPVKLKEDKSIFCIGEIPPNSILTLLTSGDSHIEVTVQKILSRLTIPSDSANLFIFYCAGRRLHLGLEEAKKELRQIKKNCSDKKIAGVLSLGEIGSTTSGTFPFFHNATIVLSCI